MIPIVFITGQSNSGKTTLVEKLIGEFTGRGVKVGTIKFSEKEIEVDREGKDSWRHKAAGATGVVIVSPKKIAAIRSEPASQGARELAERFLFDADLVLAEGYSIRDFPYIAVHRNEIGGAFKMPDDKKPKAVVTDDDLNSGDIPKFGTGDVKNIANFIAKNFIEKVGTRRVHLMVNDKVVPMKDFVREILDKTIRGMIGTFRGVEAPKKITIIIEE